MIYNHHNHNLHQCHHSNNSNYLVYENNYFIRRGDSNIMNQNHYHSHSYKTINSSNIKIINHISEITTKSKTTTLTIASYASTPAHT